ncbi:aspartate aminotransferase [Holotrichia oblita]|uniref:Aspartate aminotransferase n=1 Tax=Holotrichia oblita TaxID=644536 RepID=A0ACB9TGZ5_HOLOL|nr:aspartate aminotransferase [Holotrichia oblita]
MEGGDIDRDRCGRGSTAGIRQMQSEKKVNLTINSYQDDTGTIAALASVQKAEKLIHAMNVNKEYAPILGDPKFISSSIKFALGEDNEYFKNGLAVSLQTLGGSGALRVGFTLINKFYDGKKIVFIPNPSWKYHERIIRSTGLEVSTYKYYDPMTKDVDFNSMMEDIKKMPDRSIILFNACGHDPTGMDPTKKQWAEISTQIKSKNILAVLDMPVQGLASGDPERDAFAVRKFVADGNKIMFTLSFSRSMCLYGERPGCLCILVNSKDEAAKLSSQLKMIIRGLYSNPPVNGSRIVVKVLEDPGLRMDWRSELREMADRLVAVRRAFKQSMIQLGSKVNWDHFDRSVGLVTMCGLSLEQIEKLMKEHFVFLNPSGRMVISALNSKNIDYVTRSFHEVTK